MLKEKDLIRAAAKKKKTIVYPEAGFCGRVIDAAFCVRKKKIANLILIGDESAMVLRNKNLNKFQILNPRTSDLSEVLAKALYKKRKEKGITQDEAEELILDPYYFATMMVEEGYADGMVGGAKCSTAKLLRPALQIIKAEKAGDIVSSCFLMLGRIGAFKNKEVILADCAVNKNPTSAELVQIANASVKTALSLGMEPRVAFLSYSTHGSAKGTQNIEEAAQNFKNNKVVFDGEVQFDAAVNERIMKQKCPESPLKGNANVLIFPDLNAGNIAYMAIQQTSCATMVGAIVQGLKKPVNKLPRGASVKDIVLLTAITVLQCR